MSNYISSWDCSLKNEDNKQEYFDNDALPPGDYRILRRVYGKDSEAQARHDQMIKGALPLPVPVVAIVLGFLPPVIHREVLAPNKFGCCCCLKFEVSQPQVTEQLGFPRCCLDPYTSNNEAPKWLFYFATRALVFGPLGSLAYAVGFIIAGAAGSCCANATAADWALTFIPCWVTYAVTYAAYFVYASSDTEYLQGDYDEGTGFEGCYVSICMVGVYVALCVSLTIGLCYAI